MEMNRDTNLGVNRGGADDPFETRVVAILKICMRGSQDCLVSVLQFIMKATGTRWTAIIGANLCICGGRSLLPLLSAPFDLISG